MLYFFFHKKRSLCFKSGPGLLLLMVLLLTACDSAQSTATPSRTNSPPVNISTLTNATTISTYVNSSTPTLLPAKVTSVPVDWEKRWLKGVPCRPPCFEGITPGKTTAVEALKLLQQNPLIATASMPPGKGNSGWVIWNWFANGQVNNAQNSEGGDLLYDPLSASIPLIYAIRPKFSTSFKLSEIIQAYGEPSHVIASFRLNPEESTLSYYIFLVYLKQGFIVGTTDSSTVPFVSPDLSLNSLEFFTPGLDNFNDFYPYYAKLMLPWEGFKSYRFYCRVVNEAPNVRDCNGIFDRSR